MQKQIKVITIYNEKGGVGKTTLAGTLGAGLAIKGYRVCLLDADQQGSLTKNMKVPRHAGFYNFVKRNDKNSPDYVETKRLISRPPEGHHPENLYIVGGNGETSGIPLSTKLKDIVKSVSSRIADLSNYFDYVIIDTQPSATTLHDAIALVSDWFIIPTELEPLSAYGGVPDAMAHILGVHEQFVARGIHNKARILGIVPNRTKKRNLHEHVLGTLIKEHGDLVWDEIPERINISESQLLQTSIMFDAPELEANTYLWQFINRVEQETMEAQSG